MRILLWHHQFLQIWWANKKHFKSLLEIRTSTSERQISSFMDCLKIKHCPSQQSPQSNHKRPLLPQQKQLSIKSLQPHSRLPNHWINNPDQLQPLRLRKKHCSLINHSHLPAKNLAQTKQPQQKVNSHALRDQMIHTMLHIFLF